MTIQYCSDLHLEIPDNEHYLKNNPLVPSGEVLILAGDIVPFSIMDRHSWFFDRLAQQYEAVYWLPGNHEYYDSHIEDRSGAFKEAIRPNVWLINNACAQHGPVTLACSTLWTSISPVAEQAIAHGMADYRNIKRRGERLRPLHTYRMHKTSRRFIEDAVKQTGKNLVIATHHVPTFMHHPEEYRHSPLNEAFASELSPFIENSGARAWIYGHHHRNTPAFHIGQTAMLNNQLGYVKLNEHHTFNPSMTLTL
jgi:predicted phosphohydrolase